MRITKMRGWAAAIALAGAMFALSPVCGAAADSSQDVAAAVKAKLQKSEFKDVQVSASAGGVVTLSGSVNLYEYKQDADRIAHKVKGVKAVDNAIQVGGANVSDAAIEKKLGPELAFSREGYGNVFDAILLHVQNGVVTLSGHCHDYPDRDAAVALASTTPGVKEVIDDIEVDPVSQMDWQIRMAVARAIYGYPPLEKYAINPVRPIRISVQNGHVELYGTVDNSMDKQLVMTRAQEVPGVFSVKDYLQVQGQAQEQQEK